MKIKKYPSHGTDLPLSQVIGAFTRNRLGCMNFILQLASEKPSKDLMSLIEKAKSVIDILKQPEEFLDPIENLCLENPASLLEMGEIFRDKVGNLAGIFKQIDEQFSSEDKSIMDIYLKNLEQSYNDILALCNIDEIACDVVSGKWYEK